MNQYMILRRLIQSKLFQKLLFQRQTVKMISIKKLLVVATQIACQSCEIVHKAVFNPKLKRYYKERDNDFATQADLLIQSMTFKRLKSQFPQLRLIGQQNQQYQGQIELNYSKIDEEQAKISQKILINQQLPYKDVCLWIDPVDSTTGLVNGNPENCSILIGITYRGQSYAGVVAVPFKKVGIKSQYSPSIYVGSVGQQKCYKMTPQNNEIRQMHKLSYKIGDPIEIGISNSHHFENVSPYDQILSEMNAKTTWATGIGSKIAMVAQGKMPLLVFLPTWSYMWDTCGPQAIVKSMGGYFTDAQRNSFVYDWQNPDKRNYKGFITSTDVNLQQYGYKIQRISGGPHQ